ncbi:MAG: lipoprotein NlpI [Shewanella sp.]|nr:lipoprotein NlpI [Shewanella sp.]
MKRNLHVLLAVLGINLLVGCASTNNTALLVEPALPEQKAEINIARLNEILTTVKLTPEQKARFHYERGVSYDKVGLRLLARYDFQQALKLEPTLADAYNFLGIYYTQEGNFNNAYEAFDAVLELAPNYDYAHLNRGISLYYGGRNDLALGDLQTFHDANPKDGYRSLWLYIANREKDDKAAAIELKKHRQTLANDEWSTAIVDYYLGELSESQLLTRAKLDIDLESAPAEKVYAEHLCEAYFYMAKQAAFVGNNDIAKEWFRLTLATGVHDYVEYRYAGIELVNIEQK